MSHRNIIRAWKDEEYRKSLSEAERALLPENPAGQIELTDAEMDQAAGGTDPWWYTKPLGSRNCCWTGVESDCDPYP